MTFEKDGISQIEYQELQKIVDTKQREPIIIDVREPDEYSEGHIPNIPLVPMEKIPPMISKFDKSKEYILVCRSGVRSQHVAQYFKEHGIDNVRNYSGGMLVWKGSKNKGLEYVIKDVSELYK